MKLTDRSRVLFLLVVVLGVFYPSIFNEVNFIDDLEMIASLDRSEMPGLGNLFLPAGDLLYYRPLLLLTFWADKYFWGLDPSFMHLENVLLHAANTLLVFIAARQLFALIRLPGAELPLLAALLFALHPINTEPVNWISGRADLLGTFFVLVSLGFLLRGVAVGRLMLFLTAAGFLVAGCMSKEVMVSFLPVALLLIWYLPRVGPQGKAQRRVRYRQLLVFVAPFLVIGMTLALVRLGASENFVPSFPELPYDFQNLVRVSFKVLGFYVKKLFLPTPLNFAIVGFSDHYVWVGVAVSAILFWGGLRRKSSLMWFGASAVLILPGVVIALTSVAWTPVAERYLYLPSVFFCIAVVVAVSRMWGNRRAGHAAILAASVVLVCATTVTAQRNLTWQSNLALYEQTQKQSPDFNSVHNEVVNALIGEGELGKAENLAQKALAETSGPADELLRINLARIQTERGEYLGARKTLLVEGAQKATASLKVLKVLGVIDGKRLHDKAYADEEEKRRLLWELVETFELIFSKDGDPEALYRAGRYALFLGERDRASKLFQKTYDLAPEDVYYKIASGKLTRKLAEQ